MTSITSPVCHTPINLLAGGHWHPGHSLDPLLFDCLAKTGIAAPSVAYIGAASDDNPGFFRKLSAAFRAAGAGSITLVPLASGTPNMDSAHRILTAADLIFISGGDVKAGMNYLYPQDLPQFLRQLHKHGKPFLGLSAGSIMLAQHWIHWEDPDDNATASSFPCLGLAPLLCDTHAEDDDWQELRTLLELLPEGPVGYGIPTGGGLRVTGPKVVALGRSIQRFHREKGRIRELAPLTPKTNPQSIL